MKQQIKEVFGLFQDLKLCITICKQLMSSVCRIDQFMTKFSNYFLIILNKVDQSHFCVAHYPHHHYEHQWHPYHYCNNTVVFSDSQNKHSGVLRSVQSLRTLALVMTDLLSSLDVMVTSTLRHVLMLLMH